jgi:hypothetical protein
MNWLVLLKLVRDIGLEVVLPIIRAVHKGDETSAQEKLSQAMTARASGRAAYDASKSVGKP